MKHMTSYSIILQMGKNIKFFNVVASCNRMLEDEVWCWVFQCDPRCCCILFWCSLVLLDDVWGFVLSLGDFSCYKLQWVVASCGRMLHDEVGYWLPWFEASCCCMLLYIIIVPLIVVVCWCRLVLLDAACCFVSSLVDMLTYYMLQWVVASCIRLLQIAMRGYKL